MSKKFFFSALVIWSVVALIGLFLRYLQIGSVGVNFSHWLHAHSHAAFLGWMHAALTVLLTYALAPSVLSSKIFRRLFWFSQLMVAGMLISFPIQGYKFFSVLFLSLFLLGTYVWAWVYLKKINHSKSYPFTFSFGKTGIFFMILSSISPWILGAVIHFFGKNSIWYKLDIFFYLHFQYNGWFFFAILALLIFLAERSGIILPADLMKKAEKLLILGVLLGYVTNVLWIEPPLYFHLTAFFSVILEAWGLWILYGIYKNLPAEWKQNHVDGWMKWIGLGFAFKVIFQLMASCPYLSQVAYIYRDFIIGYLHFVLLGIYSVFVLRMAMELKILEIRKMYLNGFFLGWAGMIIFIFLKGFILWLGWPGREIVLHLIFTFTFIMVVFILLITKDAYKELHTSQHSGFG